MRHIVAGSLMICTLMAGNTLRAENVNVHNFVRAETDTAIRVIYDKVGFGTLLHIRQPVPLDQQYIIRMNRDTLYSSIVLDLSEPAMITLPDADGRYISMHVIDQDHYMYAETEPGNYKLTEKNVGTRYATVNFRIFMNADDPDDITAANAVQDQIKVKGISDAPLDVPEWNQEQLLVARGALNTLAKLGTNAENAFGRRGSVDIIDYIIAAAGGWGGLPQENAFYEIGLPANNDGTPMEVTIKDVPVNAFWSITVYNSDGYLQQNDLDRYAFNNVTADRNTDDSVTIHFGGCEDGRVNCIPVTEGWNYVARMYEPRAEILSGEWVFPEPTEIK